MILFYLLIQIQYFATYPYGIFRNVEYIIEIWIIIFIFPIFSFPGVFKVTPGDVINDPSVVAHGPLSGHTDDDSLEGVNPCEMYNVILQVDLNPG